MTAKTSSLTQRRSRPSIRTPMGAWARCAAMSAVTGIDIVRMEAVSLRTFSCRHPCDPAFRSTPASWRHGRDSNPRISVLQTAALPLRHRAVCHTRLRFRRPPPVERKEVDFIRSAGEPHVTERAAAAAARVVAEAALDCRSPACRPAGWALGRNPSDRGSRCSHCTSIPSVPRPAAPAPRSGNT